MRIKSHRAPTARWRKKEGRGGGQAPPKGQGRLYYPVVGVRQKVVRQKGSQHRDGKEADTHVSRARSFAPVAGESNAVLGRPASRTTTSQAATGQAGGGQEEEGREETRDQEAD